MNSSAIGKPPIADFSMSEAMRNHRGAGKVNPEETGNAQQIFQRGNSGLRKEPLA